MVELTLDKMASGGMYDQLGGGFHRYSTDERWLVPHFEKMLYDNALLAPVYLDAFKVTGKDIYVSIAGGARVVEPAADLPVAIAVASSALDVAVGDVAAWGEIGLTGEVRAVPDEDRRRAEAERLSIPRIVAPAPGKSSRIGDALAEAGLNAAAAALTAVRAAG